MSKTETSELTRAERIFVRISILQTILAVAGMFTGAVALYAALSEADAVRKQQQASVWPYIGVTDANIGIEGQERFEIIVSNKGIGPARIRSVAAEIDGEEVTSWYDVVEGLAEGAEYGISNFPLSREVLASNESVRAMSIEVRYAPRKLVIAFRDLIRSGRANMTLCYCSVFDDCWSLDALNNTTVETDGCPEQNPESNI